MVLDYYQSDPNSNDSDGDGFDDGIEVAKNWNPISSAESWVVDYIKGSRCSDGFRMHKDLRIGSQTFDVSVTEQLRLECI